MARTAPTLAAPLLADPLLALAADVLTDLESAKIANENRLRQLTRTVADSDGELRGFGLDERHPDVARLRVLVDALRAAEHDADLQLRRQMRRHPLGPWVAATSGIGERQAARLLAAIGDPYWNTLHDRPRTVSELWAYCGYHVVRASHVDRVAQRLIADAAEGGGSGHNPPDPHTDHAGVAASRTRGTQSNWSPTARTRAHLVALSCMKARSSPYRIVYDEARVKYADATHPAPCRRCGPAGHPAEIGTPLSASHQNARALRLVVKAVLRDLWRESRRLHAGTDPGEDPI